MTFLCERNTTQDTDNLALIITFSVSTENENQGRRHQKPHINNNNLFLVHGIHIPHSICDASII